MGCNSSTLEQVRTLMMRKFVDVVGFVVAVAVVVVAAAVVAVASSVGLGLEMVLDIPVGDYWKMDIDSWEDALRMVQIAYLART